MPEIQQYRKGRILFKFPHSPPRKTPIPVSDLTHKNSCTILHISNCPLPNQTITREGIERHKMAQMKKNFSEGPVLSLRRLTPHRTLCEAMQLYDNGENGTEWNSFLKVLSLMVAHTSPSRPQLRPLAEAKKSAECATESKPECRVTKNSPTARMERRSAFAGPNDRRRGLSPQLR